MTGDRQERIRNRAYQIWLDEGKPHDQHERHWAQAIADVDREDAGGPKLEAAASPSTEQVAGAGPALAQHSKDAAPKTAGRKPRRADK